MKSRRELDDLAARLRAPVNGNSRPLRNEAAAAIEALSSGEEFLKRLGETVVDGVRAAQENA